MTSVSEEKNSQFGNSMKLLALNLLCAITIFGLAGINNLPTWRMILFILVFGGLYRTTDFVRQAFGLT